MDDDRWHGKGVAVAYEPSAWFGFAAALAGIAGSLTGLLFVAVSIKSAALSASQNLRSRAAQSLVLFMTSVLIALLIGVPQHRVALGLELVVLAIGTGLLMVVLDHRARATVEQETIRRLEQFSPNAVTAILVAIGGATLVLKAGGGLYWVLTAAIASILGGVVSSWLFLVKIGWLGSMRLGSCALHNSAQCPHRPGSARCRTMPCPLS
jgi:uncharacterized membrane protein